MAVIIEGAPIVRELQGAYANVITTSIYELPVRLLLGSSVNTGPRSS